MTYLDAAIAVLKTAPKAMTVADITERALREELIHPRGKTPGATMSAALYLYARDAPTPVLKRYYRPGPSRAVRDSVRWLYVG